MRKFVIDRSKWRCGLTSLNGHGKGRTLLLNKKGYMCCLGQIACQLGVKKKNILGVRTPTGLDVDLPPLTNDTYGDSDLSMLAMDINDSIFVTKKEREQNLRELFNNYGYKLVFTNKYEPKPRQS